MNHLTAISPIWQRCRRVGLLLSLCALLVGSCSSDEDNPLTPSRPWTDARALPQPAIVLSGLSLPNTNISVEYASRYFPPLDADSIEMTEMYEELYYHPVSMIHRCFHFLSAYMKTRDTAFLLRAEKYVGKLRETLVYTDSAAFVPYPFDYNIHKQRKLKLKTPWYSAMAQGELLSVVVRLYELTSKEVYRTLADQLFASLLVTQGTGKPWVSRIDTAGYLWLEEYPLEKGLDQTLNGFVAAVYGVYDYWRVTQRQDAKRLYDACLTTLKHYVPMYRRPDSLSYYCLGHHHVADSSYHALHISMCRELFRISGDSAFHQAAVAFERDVRPLP